MPPQSTPSDDDPPEVPSSDPVVQWMTEVTIGLTRLGARLGAVEKSLDQSTSAVVASTNTATAATAALERIAKADEERNRWEQEGRAERLDLMRGIFRSQPAQFLLLALVMAALNYIGLNYQASQILKAMSTQGTSTTAPP